jgi:hypothetical protein
MEYIISNDKHKMNWFRDDFEYAEVLCPSFLSHTVEIKRQGDIVTTSIQFHNHGKNPVFTSLDTMGIRFPLQDRYEGIKVCVTKRCHVHIFCGWNVSYIMALRMGGEEPHLGMTLTEGSLGTYSIQRDLKYKSNDRGCFILHPSPVVIAPDETYRLSWVIFPHAGKEDFYRKLPSYAKYVHVEVENYISFPGERNTISIKPSFVVKSLKVNGEVLSGKENVFTLPYIAEGTGERRFDIDADGIKTYCVVFDHASVKQLTENRCRYLCERQQYLGSYKPLYGAYLTYDTEEHHSFYSKENDFNGSRERVGMGVLMALALQNKSDESMENSLGLYTDYVLRELVDPATGLVTNDYERNDSYKREYNYPWFATFFLELYHLYDDVNYIKIVYQILIKYYALGGEKHYPINLPVLAITEALSKEGMTEEKLKLQNFFTRHAECIKAAGICYPPHEVNYEQSIVAPAADVLLQVYLLTKNVKYLEEAKQHVELLDLFNGLQPDYHLHECAIRHWDGFWFGKRRLYGDTFPHYWSALTGVVFDMYGKITGERLWIEKARHSIRGVLPMFNADGSASCAYIFPLAVNGKPGKYFDPYANDQDWGLYFLIRHINNNKSIKYEE